MSRTLRSLRRGRARHLGAILAAAALAAVSLAPATRADAVARAAGPSGNLAVVIGYEPASLDPAVDYDQGGAPYLGNVYDNLVRAVGEHQAKLVPDLATSWSQSPDGKTWTFRLRPGVRFHDGSPVNAAAVKFSFERLLKANQGAVSDFVEISHVDAVDPLTVRFHLQYPFSSFLATMSTLWGAPIVSPKTVGNHKIAANGTSYLNDHDAGSGPYLLASYVHHQKIVLKAFPGYWRGWRGPHVQTVTIEWPASSSTQRLELERGGIDATDNLTAQDFAAVAQESGIQVREYTAQTIREIRINTKKGALGNKLVRQALSYAFDYDGVIRGVYQGHAVRMTGIAPTGVLNYVPVKHRYTFDLNKATSLLAQAGYAKKKLSFTISYLPDDTQAIQIAQIFQADLAKIGVMLKLQGVPLATLSQIDQKPSTNPDIFIGTLTLDYPDDANQYWTLYYSKNVAPIGINVFFYNDPATDHDMILARVATDPQTAYRYWQQAVDRIYDAAIEIWVAQPSERVALRSNVHGYSYNFLYTNFYYPLYDMYKS